MQILNRKIAPQFKIIDTIPIFKADQQTLDNGIPVYVVNLGDQDVIKVEIAFDAGIWYQTKNLVAGTVIDLINEGTSNATSAEIAEQLDYYGAYLSLDIGKHSSYITLYTLNQFFEPTIAIIEDIIKNAIFPDKEITTYLLNRKQQYIINRQKVDKIANKAFHTALFGANHPYGKHAELNDFSDITSSELMQFYKKYYISNNCRIMLAGKYTAKHLEILNTYLGATDWKGSDIITPNYEIITSPEKSIYIEKTDAVQSALRLGKVMFNKTHPEWPGLQIVNTILGGYFGSRLMTNIREDKGFTYGIHSALSSYTDSGYFVISSEVGKNTISEAITEIKKEMKLLRTEKVESDELDLVRNYLMGEMLQAFDGPMSISDTIRSVIDFKLGYEYFDTFIHEIKHITPEKIQFLANTYFHEDTLIEVVAG